MMEYDELDDELGQGVATGGDGEGGDASAWRWTAARHP